MTAIGQTLAINATALLAVILLLWAYSVKIRDVSFIDAFWAFGMVLLAWASWTQSDAPGTRSQLLLGLTTLWGLRLSLHLWTRWRAHGEDVRYARMLGKARKAGKYGAAAAQVFAVQAVLLYVTCLPAQLGQISAEPTSIGVLGWIGIALALTGIAFETIGDAQLTAFRGNAANAGKVLDTGLWRYTRHPNYFGDV